MFYRNTPTAAPEGDVVVGAPLTTAQADGNIKGLSDRLVAVENEVETGWTGLDITAPFSVTGNNLYAKLTNGQTYGPYPIPTVSWNLTNPPGDGAWLPNHQYYSFDVFNVGSTLYLVQWAHISATTFDPNANDGHGHNYYAVVLSMPGSTVLPPGGTQEQVLMKNSSTDYDVEWGTVFPTGGTRGQGLIKNSSTDYDIVWGYAVPPGGALGQFLTKRSAADFDVIWLTTATGVTIGSTVIPGGGASTSLAGLTSIDLTATGTIDINNDTFLGRAAAATWRLGQGDAAAPIGQTLAVQDVASGTTDGPGADFAITGSLSTGLGPGGALVFYTAPQGTSSGTTQNNLVEAGRIDGFTGAARWRREFRQSETSNYVVQISDGGTQFDNAEATGSVNFSLPSPQLGIVYGFCVVASYALTVTAPAGCSIAIGSSVSAAAGHVSASAPYCYLVLEAVSATVWAAKSATGTWTVT